MTGEEWLVKKIGAYLPGAYEEVVELVDAYVLTEKVRITLHTHTCTCKFIRLVALESTQPAELP